MLFEKTSQLAIGTSPFDECQAASTRGACCADVSVWGWGHIVRHIMHMTYSNQDDVVLGY